MALLVYSNKCKYSNDILQFIDQNPSIKGLVTYHDVTRKGIPGQFRDKITRVPTMITKNGKFLIGSEVKQWLSSLVPNQWESAGFGGGLGTMNLEDNSCDSDLFSLDSYGQSLQPMITPELEKKISQDVKSAAAEFNAN